MAHSTQNFLVVWLADNDNEVNNPEGINIIRNLKRVVHSVYAFSDMDKCIDFITRITKEKVFFISSDAFGLEVITTVHKMPQVSCIYLFGEHRAHYKKWTIDWSKIRGAFTEVVSLCDILKKTVHAYEQNSISISFVKPLKETDHPNLDDVDRSFMYTQVLKEILFSAEFQPYPMTTFVQYCHTQVANNPNELANVKRLAKEYNAHAPIWWYTYPSFLQSMLNRALRQMEVDLIIKMSFFVRDLHRNITTLHKKQTTRYKHFVPLTVYRGQGLSKIDFYQLTKSKGGFLSFNNFLLTNTHRQTCLDFARETMETSELKGILFAIEIDTPQSSTPFADVRNVSYVQESENFLFSIQSIFRIGEIKQLGSSYRLWQVSLTPVTNEDPQLLALTEFIRKETFSHLKGWYRLGNLLLELGQFDKAEHVLESMLMQGADDREQGNIYHKLGEVKEKQGKHAEAIKVIEKSLEIRDHLLPSTGSNSNNPNIRRESVYRNSQERSIALLYHQKALQLRLKTLTPDHVFVGLSYNNIGWVYHDMGEYSKALSYHEKALAIFQKFLPPRHFDLATSHHNMGLAYYGMGEYAKALASYGKALKIRQAALSSDDPDLATSYVCYGSACYSVGAYSKSFASFEKAIEISRKTLQPYHADLVASYSDIIMPYSKAEKYSKAFSACGRALEIYQNATPQNTVDLATSYNNIGGAYNQMGAYSKALSCFKKALEIFEKTLLPNHPDLATAYSNVGGAHFELENYPQALSLYEKALDIRKAALPPNHPDFAQSYNNLGGVYFQMKNYSEASRYCKSALELGKRLLPSEHPDLRNYQHWIEIIEPYL